MTARPCPSCSAFAARDVHHAEHRKCSQVRAEIARERRSREARNAYRVAWARERKQAT